MDAFISLAKQGMQAYEASQHSGGGGGGEGGEHAQNRPHPESHGVPHVDHDEVVHKANTHAEGSGDAQLFTGAMHHLTKNNEEHKHPVHEEHVTNSHKQAYEEHNAKGLDAGGMGAAAALQAFKMFTSGKSGKSESGGGGGGASQLISLAMGEASKLFEASGGPSKGGGGKQDVVNHAAMTMMKLVVQSKLGGGSSGGHHGSGLSSLLKLAEKHL